MGRTGKPAQGNRRQAASAERAPIMTSPSPIRTAVLLSFFVLAPLAAQPVVTSSSLERVQACYRIRGDAKPRVEVTFDYTPSTWKDRFDEVLDTMDAAAFPFGGGGYANLDTNVPLRVGGLEVPVGLHRVGLRRSGQGQWFLTLLSAERARESDSVPGEGIVTPIDLAIPLQVADLEVEQAADPLLRVDFVPDSRQLGRSHLRIRWFRRQADVEVFTKVTTERPRGLVDIPPRPWDGETRTASGLVYQQVRAGKGDGVRPGEKGPVTVRYTMWSPTGEVLDRTQEGRRTLQMDRLVPGMKETLMLMEAGAIFHAAIPSELAYGERGAGDRIRPGTDLTLRIELVEID